MKFECKMIISPSGEIFVGKDKEGHIDICSRILDEYPDLLSEFSNSFEKNKELFLIQRGYVHFDFVIGNNDKSNLMVLYNSKNLSTIMNNIISSLFDEKSKKQVLIMLFKKYISREELEKLNDVYILSDDVFEHLDKKHQKMIEEEIIANGIKSANELMAIYLPWNQKSKGDENNEKNRKSFK